jgi:hypothetical protein
MGTYFAGEQYKEVNFLGYTVTVPSAERINDYREKMQKIINAYNVVDQWLQKQVNECKSHGSSAWSWIQTKFWASFDDDDNGDIVWELQSLMGLQAIGIYPPGVASEEFAEYTKGYKELGKLRRILVQEAKEILTAYESNYERGQNEAFRNASSSIKGLGFGIITNSAVDLLAYNAISNATIRSQAKKADAQYN